MVNRYNFGNDLLQVFPLLSRPAVQFGILAVQVEGEPGVVTNIVLGMIQQHPVVN